MKTAPNRALWPLLAVLCLLTALVLWLPKRSATVTEASPPAETSKRVKFTSEKPKPLPEIDVRRTSVPTSTPPQDRAEAFAELKRQKPMLQAQFDEISGAPSYLQETGKFLTGKNPGKSAKEAVKDYVSQFPGLFGHDAAALDKARVTREDVTAHNGMTTLVWQQQHAGIPLYNTIFKANVSQAGEVITVSDHFLPDTTVAAGNQDVVPGLDVQEAISKAAAALGDAVPATAITAKGEATGAEQKQSFTAEKLSDTTALLNWMPLAADDMRLAWNVTTFSLERNEMYQTIVDAESGELLYRRSLTADISDASYRIFTTESPTPFSPGHETPSSLQPAQTSRILFTTAAMNTTASPNGWINDGGMETNGNNVDAHTDNDATANSPDLPRPNGGAARVFDFPLDLTQEPSTYEDASVTQLFYWTNFMHDRMYEMGFTESAGNFQVNNFGRGGLGNDAIQADAQDGSGTDNANFSTPADGSPGRMQMYVWTSPTPDRDGSFESEVVLHEIGHGVTNRLVGGGVGISALSTRGMGEGWSDFYGLALTAEATDNPHGNWARGGYSRYLSSGWLSENYYYGARRYSYSTDMLKNPLTLKDIDPTQIDLHTNVPRNPTYGSTQDATQVHYQGTVWCAMLWDMRANLILKHGFNVGNDRAIRLVTDGCKLSPVNPNFVQARDGIIQATLVSFPGDMGEVWTAFAKRGAGQGATAPASSSTTGIVESYTVPDSLQISDRSGWNIRGNKGGPFTPGTKVLTLSNSGAGAVNWSVNTNAAWLSASPASGTLAAGGNVVVTITTQADAVAPGFHSTNVVFTNTGTSFNQPIGVRLYVTPPVVQTFSLDSDPGWTRTGEWAFGTPTGGGGTAGGGSGNVDPAAGATGTSVFGVNLTGNHSTGVTGPHYLTSGAVNLSLYTKTRLRFQRWLNANTLTNSRLTVEVSTDGTNWREVFVNPGTTITENAWTLMDYDISSLADQQSAVQVRWSYRTLVASAYAGWNIDDVQFLGEATNGFTITSANSATESDGPVTATLTMSIPQVGATTVALTSSDPTAATVPASVTLAGGETSTTFQITPLDDTVPDGTQTTVITASAAGVGLGTKNFSVLDDETATLMLSLPVSVTEGGAAGTATVTRSVVNSSPVTVTLASSDPTAATVPESVVIPGGQASVNFSITPVNDTKIDGTQSTLISAAVTNWTGASGSVDVLDNEGLNLTVTAPVSVTEGGTGSGSVSISGTLTTPLVVNLSSNQTKLTVPASVTIAAGATSASFTATAPNDALAEANVTAMLTASAVGFTNGSGNTTVIDNDLHHFAFATITSPKTLGSPFSITITAQNFSNSTVTGFTGTAGLSGTGASGAISMTPTTTTAFVAGVWNSSITINTPTTNIVLTANDGAGHTGTSNSFTVGTGSLHHFAFSNIASPKTVGTAFGTTITAQDIANNTVTTFASTATLSAPATRTVGTGTLSTSTLPLYTFYHDQRSQCIYLQGEIGGATTIRGLTLNVTTVPGQTMNNWTIRMKHTTLNSYVTNAWESTGWTTVYQANETISTTGLKTFTFTTPFAYNGSSNLMVDLSFNNSSYTTQGAVTYTTANANRSIYAFTDSGFGDPLTWSGTGSPTPTATTLLPNLLLQTGQTVTMTPTSTGAFTAGVWTGNVTMTQPGAQVALQALSGTSRGYSNDFAVNSTVTANAQSITVPYNTATAVTLTGQDSANPGATLTYTVLTNPTNGALSGTAPNLTYTPTTGYQGADSFTFRVANGAIQSASATVSITVQPPPPEIVVEQPVGTGLTDAVSTVDYGSIPTGSGTVRTFTVRNTGTMDLVVSGITKDGTNSTEITIGSLSASTIAAGGSATFDVTFTPAVSAARSAAIHILSNDSDEASFDIALTATGSASFPDIAVEQPVSTLRPDAESIIDFGAALLNTPVLRTFTLRNTGSSTLTVSGSTIDGTNASLFTAGAPSTTTIAAGSSATLDVTFIATTPGVKYAALHVNSNDPDESPYDIELYGIGSLASGPLTLTKNINALPLGGTITNFIAASGFYYYQFNAGIYRTDGTVAGTNLISFSVGSTAAGSMAMLGTTLVYAGTDITAGTELWTYNGTTAARLADINAGTTASTPGNMTVVGSTVYFTATTAANGQELWKTDGTFAGTVLVKDINGTTASSSITSLTNVNGTLFFAANDGTNGTELWKSDGTTAGTVMVSNINATAGASSSPASFVAIGGTVYFSATNGSTGVELYKSDGTTTSIVLDINSGSASSSPAALFNWNGTLYFRATTAAAGAELWKSDGTPGGTVLVRDIFSGTTASTPAGFTPLGAALYFSATDSTANGVELWRTDGSNAGTVMVANINTAASGSSSPTLLTAVGSSLFFYAADSTNGSELWRTNGTTTVRVEDINTGIGSSSITTMVNLGSLALFGATDGVTGLELWRSDGTAAGTFRLPEGLSGDSNPGIGNVTALGSVVFFSATDGLAGTELWKSDGTNAGTVLVRDIQAGSSSGSPANFSVVNSTLYFSAVDTTTNGTELWKSDGTNAGTVMVANINPAASGSSSPTLLRNVGGTLFFAANDGVNGTELWKSDGTGGGTVMVKNINPTAGTASSISGSVVVDSLLYFSANDGTNGQELWKSDGTNAGTVMVKNIHTTAATSSSPANITQVGTTIFFTATDGVAGVELWKTDGTDAGTLLVKDINPGATSASPTNLVAYNGILYFYAADGVNGAELWRSDGTNAGTLMLKDINPGVNSSSVANFRVHNSILYFAAADSFGTELWRTDGTAVGTYQVRDIFPGTTASSPANLTSAGGYLYFSASAPGYGAELWRTDGTTLGTQLLADLYLGGIGSSPALLTPAGGRLYFTANLISILSTELFSLDLGAEPEIAVYEGTDTTGVERQDNTGTYSFGTQSTATARSFTLKNNGTSYLFVSDIAVGGENADSFFVTGKPDPSLAIQPGATVTFTVTASLEGPPVQNAVVSILCNDSNEASFDIPVTVTVDDTTPPVITAPATYLIGQPGTLAMSLPDLRGIVAYTDNRAGDGTITQDPIPGDIVVSIGEIVTVSFTATDSSGNVSNTVTTQVQMGLGQPNTGHLAWARAAGSIGNEATISRVAATPDGGVVVAGVFSASPFVIGSGADQVSLTTAGGADIFVARFDKDGRLLWTRRAGSTSTDSVNAMMTLPDGSVIITGIYSAASLVIEGVTLTNGGGNDTYIARYMPDGTFTWAKGFGGTGGDSVTQMTLLSDGNIAIAGGYGTTATMTVAPGVTLVNFGAANADLFLIKYQASDGTALWAKSFGSSATAESNTTIQLAAAPSGGVYFSGGLQSSICSITGTVSTLVNTGAAATSDVFVTKFDSAGTLQWAKNAGGGTAAELPTSLQVLSNGDAALAGTFASSPATFGVGSASPQTFTPIGSTDVFVLRLSGTDGSQLWAKRAGGIGADTAVSMLALPDNSLALTGLYASGAMQLGIGEARQTTLTASTVNTKLYVARFSGGDGTLRWAKTTGGLATNAVTGLALLGESDIGLVGTFATPSETFGPGEAAATTFTNLGTGTDVFVAKFTRVDGDLIWAKRGGGANTDAVHAITALPNGSAMVIGTFQPPSASFGAGEVGETTLSNIEATGTNTDFFFARFHGGGVEAPVAPLISLLPASDLSPFTLTFNASIDSRGQETTVVIEYGPTTSYGTSVPVTDVPAGFGTTPRSLSLTGLPSLSTMNFRVVATNAAGTTTSANQAITTYPDAEIVVEEPAGTSLTDGVSAVDFGAVAIGSSTVRTFTIRNTGATGTLSGLALSKDGAAAADYTLGTLGATTLLPGESTTFTVTFTPSLGGTRTAAIHLGSNDGDENPFDLVVTGDNFFDVTFASAVDIPITSAGYTVPAGRSLGLALSFAPAPSSVLTVVSNTGAAAISGTFVDLPDGDIITAVFGGQTYLFHANYQGGDGNDLVLSRAYDWTWVKGSNTNTPTSNYGTLGVPSPTNVLTGRSATMNWTDTQGNLWVFGGYNGVYYSDLWRYSTSTGMWTWVKTPNGSVSNQNGVYGTQGLETSVNIPGARQGGATWVDNTGKLWLFGGFGYPGSGTTTGVLNDLWRYNPATNNWTWIKGSANISTNGTYGTQGTPNAANTPGSRQLSTAWTDASDNLWLFGGTGLPATGTTQSHMNDLWKFDPLTSEWTWVKGGNTINNSGTFGTLGTPAVGNTPSTRQSAAGWLDAQGSFWLFGGSGYYQNLAISSQLGDLWRYDPATNMWTWIKGSANSAANQNGVYGRQGIASATNAPGYRHSSATWRDMRGRLWLHGGMGRSSISTSVNLLNDLWYYDIPTNQWTWVKGPQTHLNNGIYGTLGVPDSANAPGARQQAASFATNGALRDIWMLGGNGVPATGSVSGYLNDLWHFDLPNLPSVTTLAATSITTSSATLNASIVPDGSPTSLRFRYGTASNLAGATVSPWQSVGNSATNETLNLGLLSPSTTYYYQAEVFNASGAASGAILSFTTLAVPDIVVEQPAGVPLVDGSSTATFVTTILGQSNQLVFTLKNTGGESLGGISAGVDGDHAADFTVSALPATLAATGSTTFTVTFAPGGAGQRTAALHLASTDPDENPFTIHLAGTGIIVPEIVIEQPVGNVLVDGSASIAFGSASTGSSTTRTFTIRNTGNGLLTLTGVMKIGANPGDFHVVGMPSSLLPGESSSFDIIFAPAASGSRSAIVQIGSDDTDENPFDIQVNGTGISAPSLPTAALVKDVNIKPASAGPVLLANLAGITYFAATTATEGSELWRTDGTAAGTWMVKDINPGSSGSGLGSFAVMNGVLYFAASDGSAGSELWRSDGTAAGTYMVLDIVPGFLSSSSPAGLFVVGDTLFFRAALSSGSNVELWKSDGTAAGTSVVADINPGSASSTPSLPVMLNGVIYFAATTATEGTELWRSDGTAAGTYLVKDINPGTANSAPQELVLFDNRLFFRASDATSGAELWTTDGTAAGTSMLVDIHPAGSSSPTGLVVLGSELLFAATTATSGTELWKTNGTVSGTAIILDINSGTAASNPTSIMKVGAKVCFRASTAAQGSEMWVSDGTAAGTQLLLDITPGTTGSNVTPPSSVVSGGMLYFSATNAVNGGELWKSDGTTAGTVLVKDVYPGSTSSAISSLFDAGGTAYFAATDGVSGVELWKSNGTAAGTLMVKEIALGTADAAPARLIAYNNKLFFQATDLTPQEQFGTAGTEWWMTDGTSAGTSLLKDIVAGPLTGPGGDAVIFNSKLYFHAEVSPSALWESDGTTAGTTRVLSSPGNLINSMVVAGSYIYYVYNGTTTGMELWRSDGTAAGTGIVTDLQPGNGVSSSSPIMALGSTIYFSGNNGSSGIELWQSDGTAAGTVLVADINPGTGSSSPSLMFNADGTLYFSATDGVSGTELWKSDGTAAGTSLVLDINPGAANGLIATSGNRMAKLGSQIFFSAVGPGGIELWKTDGSAAGTVRVKDISPGSTSSSPANFFTLGDAVYFTANDGQHGVELWRTDGTADGTLMVADIEPSGSSSPSSLAVINGFLYFRATTSAAGAEPWCSDGTAEGTFMLADVLPGAGSSTPGSFTLAGSRLYFTARGQGVGTEIFSIDLSQPADIAVEEPAGQNLIDGVSTLDFGTVITGTSLTKNILIKNAGASVLSISSITKAGAHPAAFAMNTPGAVALPVGASRVLALTFAPTAAGSFQASIHLASNDAEESPFDLYLTAVSVTPFQQWASSQGLSGGSAAPNADPDGDGLTNTQEFAFGLNPNASSNGALVLTGGSLTTRGTPIPRVEAQTFGVNYQAAYCRNTDATFAGYTYTVQFSGDLNTWFNSTATPTVQATDGNVQAVTVPYPFLLPNRQKARFFKVIVTPP